MRAKLVVCGLWNFVLAVPDQAQKKRPAMKLEEDHNNEEIGVSGSTTSSSVHSEVLNLRMENQKQSFDFDCSCKFKKLKEALFLFPQTVIPTMKKEPTKPENQYKKEINGSTTSFVRCFSDSRMTTAEKPFAFFAYRAKTEKKVSESDEVVMPMKRNTAEAEEQRQNSIVLTLSLGYQRENKKQRTAEISLPPRADSEASTKLMLFDKTWPTENKKPYDRELSEAEKKVAFKIDAMKNYGPGEEEEKKRKGVL